MLVSFDVVGTFTNVNHEVLTTNVLTGTAATNMPLSKVPDELAVAPEIEAFLWLDGEPDASEMTWQSGLLENQWLKIGVITITLEPDMTDLDKTPKTI